MTPTTLNQDPLFIAEKPDWNRDVDVSTEFITRTFESIDGTEQRQGMRDLPRYRQAYVISGLSLSQASIRESRYISELKSPIVIPIWPMKTVVAGLTVGGAMTINGTAGKRKFRPDYHVYFESFDGHQTGFYTVTSISGTTVNVDFDPGAYVAMAGDFYVWPCLYGIKRQNSGVMRNYNQVNNDEVMEVEDL